MAYYVSREHSALAAADTAYTMNDLGGSSPGAVIVPQGVKAITGIIAAFSSDCAANEDAVAWVNLSGNGLLQGEQDIMLGAAANQGTVAGMTNIMGHKMPVLIPVTPGNHINLNAYVNADTGSASLGVTLEFA